MTSNSVIQLFEVEEFLTHGMDVTNFELEAPRTQLNMNRTIWPFHFHEERKMNICVVRAWNSLAGNLIVDLVQDGI